MKNIDKELVTSLRDETKDHVISRKTYTVEKGKNVHYFLKDGHIVKSYCVLQNTMILNRDDLVSIYECDCCENLLYQFDHSKKKFLVVEWDDLDVSITSLNITSKELYEDYEQINQMGFRFIKTLSDEDSYSTRYSNERLRKLSEKTW